MRSSNVKGIGDSRVRRGRAIRLGAAASGLAIVLVCGAAGTALGAPGDPQQAHVKVNSFLWMGAQGFTGSPAA
jgi:hypothetical protein